MTYPLPSHARTRRAVRALLVTTLLALSLLAQPVAATAATSSDYQQVVDITFPFTKAVKVQFRDDYDASRGSGRTHQSTDLMVAMGTPVHAALGGSVSWTSGSESGPPSYGWMIRIRGDDGRDYVYVHLGKQDGPRSKAYASGITAGARVERGQLIGWAGCSGSATCGGGEHLHFEIHDPNVVDPYTYHDHERINPYPSLMAALRDGDYPELRGRRFIDVDPASRHGQDIESLADSGITRGCGSGRFCPDAIVTRQQMASFLVRGLELPQPITGPIFADVAGSNVHGADITALADAGITKGCGAGVFCPADMVTRAQMASFLVRALNLPEAPAGQFSDVSRTNPHAQDIAALAAAGITRGCGPTTFCPDAPVTREQMASFLVRALGL